MLVRSGWSLLVTAGLLGAPLVGRTQEVKLTAPIKVIVRAGGHERRDSLVQFPVPANRLGTEVVAALAHGPVGLAVKDSTIPAKSVAQLARRADGSVEATWFLPRPLAAGTEAPYEIDGGQLAAPGASPWSIRESHPGAIEFRNRDRPVFRYNAAPVAPPKGADKMGANLVRDAYIHPAFSPSGALITGDFSAYHPHHRGFFLAYTHTRWGDAEPDFWNFQTGTGRIVADGYDTPQLGTSSVRFQTRHRWETVAQPPTGGAQASVALREDWTLELYDVPGSPYWLFDLASRQQAVGKPLTVSPYRYGGMAYRSAEPSVRGPLDVLTAEGKGRWDGDQKLSRWVDLTGPIAESSPNYAGAMIADHPANPHYPTAVRIHPVTLPFFCFVPAHDEPLTIPTDRPLTFRYRVLIHDGHPDPALNNRIATDFAEPVEVVLD